MLHITYDTNMSGTEGLIYQNPKMLHTNSESSVLVQLRYTPATQQLETEASVHPQSCPELFDICVTAPAGLLHLPAEWNIYSLS
jgi:hypothetical protein